MMISFESQVLPSVNVDKSENAESWDTLLPFVYSSRLGLRL